MTKQAYYKYNGDYITRLAKERFVVEYVKKIREINKGLGGEKLWLKYKQEFGEEYSLGRDAFSNILAANNLKIRNKKRKIRTTNSDHNYPRYPDLVKNLLLDRPSQVWVSDLTYIPIGENSFCFLSIVTDAFTKKIVGYYVGETLEAIHTLKALDIALESIQTEEYQTLIHHSDRGVQYACNLYTEKLHALNIKISMTERSDPKDNAIAERVNGILKYEFLNHLQLANITDLREAVVRAVRFYNEERPHRSLDMMTPYEANLQPQKIKKRWTSYKELYLQSQLKFKKSIFV